VAKKRTISQWWADVALRNKITGVTVLILSFGLIVAGVGTLSLLRPTLFASQDTELKQLQSDPSPALQPGAAPESLTREDVVFAPNIYYVALLDADGDRLYDNVRGGGTSHKPEVGRMPISWVQEKQDNIIGLRSEDGTDWRAVAVPIRASESDEASGSLLIAASTTMINSVMAQYITIFSSFGVAVILLGAALTRILVTATFEPLSEVERTAKEISQGDFSKRIHVVTPNTEVGHLGTSLNVMLDRIDGAFRDRARTLEKMRRFIGDAGHELRTPLVSVRGYAELFRLGALDSDEKVGQAMDRIENEAIRMTSLVEDLLSLARLDERRPLDMQPLDLNSFARDAAMDANVQAPDRQIQALESPDTPMAYGDEHKIRQVMTNLIGNALRHTDEGTPIEICVSAEPQCARFEIRDHGEGVPEQLREKIFDRFWRADNSRNRETGGSGLGLAIVSSIVQAHNGKIETVETPGGGATFRIDLPYADSLEADDVLSDAEDEAQNDNKPSGLRRLIPGKKSRDKDK
jgi:two-component system OmpR family sensor kinase